MSTGSAASKAASAAEALDAFQRAQAKRPPNAAAKPSVAPQPEPRPPTAHEPSAARPQAPHGHSAPPHPGHTDWLHHRLVITGPAAALDAFGRAAAGSGTVPWRLDLDTLEEDWFLLLARPDSRSLSLAGARTLAARLRQAAERRHALAVSRVGRSRACPFDLHSLVPVPDTMLRLGPDHPEALAWLWQHWGTPHPLRHVARQAPGKANPPGALQLHFWSADWTPWAAVARIRADWPALAFTVQPDYAAGG